MDFKKKIFIAIILLLVVGSFALNMEEVKGKISDIYSKSKTFQAEFSQNNYWPEYDKSSESRGKIYFNEKKMIIKYDFPQKQMLYLHSDSLIIYNSETNQEIISKNIELFSNFKINNIIEKYWNKKTSQIQENKNNINLKISINKDGIREIFLVFSKKYILKQLKYTDENENTIQISFKNLRLNEKLPKNVFKLNIPEDVNIIER